MKILLESLKKYIPNPNPIVRNCFACTKVKPLVTLEKDVFQYSMSKPRIAEVKVAVHNHFTNRNCFENIRLDYNKPSTFILTKCEKESKFFRPLIVNYNPKMNANVYQRVKNPITGQIEKLPLEVNILTSKDDIWKTTFHFMKKDLSEEIGYVTIGDFTKLKRKYPDELNAYAHRHPEQMKNYPSLNVKGDRITIDYLQNNDDKLYSGIGELAEQLCIEYCNKIGIKPNVVSIADFNSHIAHYKRGVRFLPLESGSVDMSYFIKKYKNADPNTVIKRLIEENKDSKIDISEWGEIGIYMPQDLIRKYQERIKKNPILK